MPTQFGIRNPVTGVVQKRRAAYQPTTLTRALSDVVKKRLTVPEASVAYKIPQSTIRKKVRIFEYEERRKVDKSLPPLPHKSPKFPIVAEYMKEPLKTIPTNQLAVPEKPKETFVVYEVDSEFYRGALRGTYANPPICKPALRRRGRPTKKAPSTPTTSQPPADDLPEDFMDDCDENVVTGSVGPTIGGS